MCNFIELYALKGQKNHQNKYKQCENVGDFLNSFNVLIGKGLQCMFTNRKLLVHAYANQF